VTGRGAEVTGRGAQVTRRDADVTDREADVTGREADVTGASRVIVIGVGNEFRTDDGAGPAVIARLAGRVPDSVELVTSDGEPARLVEAWTRASTAIVVDAVSSGPAPPGTLHRTVIVGPALPSAESGQVSSHGLGLGTATELARVLGRLPGMLIVHGVQAADLSQGVGLSAAVASVIDDLAAAVLADAIR